MPFLKKNSFDYLFPINLYNTLNFIKYSDIPHIKTNSYTSHLNHDKASRYL